MRLWTEILTDLEKALDQGRIKERKGQSNKVFSYLEGFDMINTANRIFGQDGWDGKPMGEVQRFEVGLKDNIVTYVYSVPYLTRFHGLLDDNTVHTVEKGDVGKNVTRSANLAEHEMAISGCATDAMKRAMRLLGNQFGNTLYDKNSDDRKKKSSGVQSQQEAKKKAEAKKRADAKKKADAAKKKAEAAKKSKPETASATSDVEVVTEVSAPTGSAIERALAYVVPNELKVDGKPVRLPNKGKTLKEVLDDPMGVGLLVWLAGIRNSPSDTPPFVAIEADEVKLQGAVSYVLLNKKREDLNEEEINTLTGRLAAASS